MLHLVPPGNHQHQQLSRTKNKDLPRPFWFHINQISRKLGSKLETSLKIKGQPDISQFSRGVLTQEPVTRAEVAKM